MSDVIGKSSVLIGLSNIFGTGDVVIGMSDVIGKSSVLIGLSNIFGTGDVVIGMSDASIDMNDVTVGLDVSSLVWL